MEVVPPDTHCYIGREAPVARTHWPPPVGDISVWLTIVLLSSIVRMGKAWRARRRSHPPLPIARLDLSPTQLVLWPPKGSGQAPLTCEPHALVGFKATLDGLKQEIRFTTPKGQPIVFWPYPEDVGRIVADLQRLGLYS
ncbi:MAG: hypothetical protein SFY70_09325 [Bacteroidia bacterium]|nr:hypothetical protein [Bacteroidia bacterium]